MQYRKKPVVIEAIQLIDTNQSIKECQEFIENSAIDNKTDRQVREWENYLTIVRNSGGIVIKTLEGNMLASFDDYIIKGIKGEFYPCKPDIFEATYEKV